MKHRRYWVGALAVLVVTGGILAAVGTAAPSKQSSQKLTKLTFQLKWVTQAQFAGYYAAQAKGYYNTLFRLRAPRPPAGACGRR